MDAVALEEPVEHSRTKARAFLALRVATSAVILFVLARRVDLNAVVPEWNARTITGLAAGAVVLLTGHAMAAWRWRRVLEALDASASYYKLLLYTLAGNFVGNFLPTTVAGDVVRVTRVSADIGSAEKAFASTTLDRLSGWVVLPLLGLVGLEGSAALRSDGRVRSLGFGLCALSLAGLGVVLAMAGSRRLGGRFHGRDGWTRFLGAVHLGLDQMRVHPIRAARVLAVAIGYQLVMVAAVWTVSWALELHVTPPQMLGVAPVVFIAQTLPLSVGGFGIREGAYAVLLHPLGVKNSGAVALGLAIYTLTIATSLVGAPAFATRSSSPKAPPSS